MTVRTDWQAEALEAEQEERRVRARARRQERAKAQKIRDKATGANVAAVRAAGAARVTPYESYLDED